MKEKTTKWEPPRGIRYRDFPERKLPFYLIWTDPETGSEKSAKFDSAAKRELAARSLAEKRAKHGEPVLKFDAAKWAKFQEFERLVGGVDAILVAHEWLASKQGKATGVVLIVRDAVTKYLALRESEATWGKSAHTHAKKHLGRFSAEFGEYRLNDIGAEEIRTFLANLKDDDGNKIGPHGVIDHRKNLSTFFAYAVRERWGALSNPVELVAKPPTNDGDPVVISVRDAFEFFKANRAEPLIGRVAMEAFGGIRYQTAGLIDKSAINFDRQGIRLKASIHKSGKKDGRTRYRQGQPGNLYAWLAHAPESCWSMDLLAYREAKRNAGIRAGIRPLDTSTKESREKVEGLRNIWRHSFISYHLARYKSLPLTQYLAQHATSRQTEDYEGMADEIDAARYFAISPETVLLTWEEFIALPVARLDPMDSAALALRLQA